MKVLGLTQIWVQKGIRFCKPGPPFGAKSWSWWTSFYCWLWLLHDEFDFKQSLVPWKMEAAPSRILISTNEALLLIALHYCLGTWCLSQCTVSGKLNGAHALGSQPKWDFSAWNLIPSPAHWRPTRLPPGYMQRGRQKKQDRQAHPKETTLAQPISSAAREKATFKCMTCDFHHTQWPWPLENVVQWVSWNLDPISWVYL